MIDWFRALDMKVASKNVRTDIFGDWYNDPWDWPEHEWLSTETGRSHVLQTLNSSDTRRSLNLDVPKENFSVRPAFIFDPVDRLVFQALVDKLSVKLIGDMPKWSYSWRLSRRNPKPGHYINMGDEWEGYRKRLNTLSEFFDVALTSDIVSFFPSIPIDRLIDSIYDMAKKTAVTERLAQLLEGWARISDRGGLPMRANASSVLASMYLRPLDDLLSHHGTIAAKSRFLKRYVFSNGTATRWVDDIWLFGRDLADMRIAQLDAQQVMRSLGLNMNLAKTDVLEGDEMRARARQLEHSAVDTALIGDDPNFEPLDELIDRMIVKPELASHTSVRFAAVRMRKYSHYGRIEQLIDVAPRMPHASQALARAFKESGKAVGLGDWYAEYLNSKWATVELAAVNFAMMFPANALPPAVVQNALETKLGSDCSLPMLAIGGHRLASWQPDRARSLFRELARKADHPLQRRVLALAALTAGESRTWITRLLSEFRENAITLEFLSERSFSQVKARADFVGY